MEMDFVLSKSVPVITKIMKYSKKSGEKLRFLMHHLAARIPIEGWNCRQGKVWNETFLQ
ncbi:MAG: hypothetical protein GF329_08630 [Candidatus Lokiarchaeota archaeon]|nr:hypothetical protein [Candidatus Lokiarchaeota archaeon]MBD3339722.1 hypothetical protein [Candidatus Lokiarchaeota archaeon]